MNVLLYSRFDGAEVVRAIHELGGTVFMGVPTMYARLLELLASHPDEAARLSKARLFCAGSAALPASDLLEFERLTGHRILERYGMSETLITLSNPYEGERRPGSVGLPIPGVEMAIVEDDGQECAPGTEGELRVRGPGVMKGYWGKPETTRDSFDARGFFKTGDVARTDADGYVTIVGRRSTDILKSGGFKISAREIEDALRSAAFISDVAIIGVPDRLWGQRIVAAVVARGAPPQDLLAALQGHVRDSLAEYKRPRAVLLLDALPRNAMGKVQKHLLVEQAVARGI